MKRFALLFPLLAAACGGEGFAPPNVGYLADHGVSITDAGSDQGHEVGDLAGLDLSGADLTPPTDLSGRDFTVTPDMADGGVVIDLAIAPDLTALPDLVGRDLAVAPDMTCPGGQTLCGNACVDTKTDSANCGGCGKACAMAQVCNGGACAVKHVVVVNNATIATWFDQVAYGVHDQAQATAACEAVYGVGNSQIGSCANAKYIWSAKGPHQFFYVGDPGIQKVARDVADGCPLGVPVIGSYD